eukprot:Blabericola_migrator_1__2421@NODE_1681_length_4015_cov_839_715299_g623_i2_p2_GENE_NODE_1681_length_4015_cov_839_715299_g623_i2NODE_1681_length_4015_cov_839_715299_g623_i2_p2_ORF_typecomplete_len174_score26_27Acetyltransf_1/PF00583_25/1_2e18Acetyltransf_10/PF13673_7/6_6e14Acetyltransf_7/PF13508_7/5_3e11Acetyltransf_4/PF13420_7/4_8e08Acetyltransf_9/PF13527_7/5_4e07Acetyltransf_9/PF13527_7/6_2e02FR47/PF08445_10/1_8e06Acetyltransf_6/PF13480_7/0_00017PanZ/PF12568_8/0_0006GNAT_acetyltran/PF12746_7/0_0
MTKSITPEIRPAVKADASAIYGLIVELAEYERARDEVVASVGDIENTLFDESGPTKAFVCEQNDRIVGCAIYFYSYSTWLGRNGLYLEDLYVTPAARCQGLGKQLLRRLAQEAVANKCGRFEWSVLDWNTLAIGFYNHIGAIPMKEWIRYRLEGQNLIAFATDGQISADVASN